MDAKPLRMCAKLFKTPRECFWRRIKWVHISWHCHVKRFCLCWSRQCYTVCFVWIRLEIRNLSGALRKTQNIKQYQKRMYLLLVNKWIQRSLAKNQTYAGSSMKGKVRLGYLQNVNMFIFTFWSWHSAPMNIRV